MSSRKSTVLIVDDEPVGQETLEALLFTQGYNLFFANSGYEALELAVEHTPDLILLDVMMPGMDGFEVCEKIRSTAALAEIPVIMITALDDRTSRLQGIESGADDFVSKPVNGAELRARVRTITRLNRYRRLNEERTKFERLFALSPDGMMVVERDMDVQLVNTEARRMLGIPEENEEPNFNLMDFVLPDEIDKLQECLGDVIANRLETLQHGSRMTGNEGNIFPVEITAGYVDWKERPAAQIIIRDITDRVEAEQKIQKQLDILQSLFTNTQKLTRNLDPEALAEDIVRSCVEILGVRWAWLGRAKPNGFVEALKYFPPHVKLLQELSPKWEPGSIEGHTALALHRGESVVSENIAENADLRKHMKTIKLNNILSSASIPLVSHEKPFGVLNLFCEQKLFFEQDQLALFETYANQAAASLENARLFTDTERRLNNINALSAIDRAIIASPDLKPTLKVLLDQSRKRLGLDSALILLYDSENETLNFVASSGIDWNDIEKPKLLTGEGLSGKLVQSKKPLVTSTAKIESEDGDYLLSFGVKTYIGFPLIAKDQVRGVLEYFHYEELDPDDEWLDFLKTIADQASIAIENANLFENLQRSNAELVAAYDETLVGWARALDLRDRDTEGHTKRVTEVTVRLADKMGLPPEDMIHVRRGALLHDIGKMGIPDSILHKPGPLNDDEWEIMRKHPEYAKEMLSHIEFLRPCIEIPYYHHEHWDGSGYPTGISGEDIPLAARLFAIVDVWDALSSNRPYRAAWPDEKVYDYILSRADTQFDPILVYLFLDFIYEEGDSIH